jgi:predicted DCC family thiol-disulfide oxidoreductase YuxK
MVQTDSASRPIVLFDGPCSLCNASVEFIRRRDPAGRFLFAPLQSDQGRRLLEEHGLPPDDERTVVLIDGGRVFTRSDATLRIVRQLRPPWPLLCGLVVVPRFVRDFVYNTIARHRREWFGQTAACPLPSAELREPSTPPGPPPEPPPRKPAESPPGKTCEKPLT